MAERLHELVDDDLTIYPESDGLPMADNTEQWNWIVNIKAGLEDYLSDNPQVFVAGDLLWYPVRGNPTIRQAPDTLVAFGRPKGPRGSYIQHREGDIAPQVVFEVLSPGNTRQEMSQKRDWYARYGVEEYYEYDPDRGTFKGWLRRAERLEPIVGLTQWISPRLGVRFGLSGKSLEIYLPDGRRMLTEPEMRQHARALENQVQLEREAKEAAWQREEAALQQIEQERLRAEELLKELEQLRAQLRQKETGPDVQ